MIPIEGGLIVFQNPFSFSEKVLRECAFSQYHENFVGTSNWKIDVAVAASRLRRSEVRMISRLLPIMAVCVSSAFGFAKGVFQCFGVIYLSSVNLLQCRAFTSSRPWKAWCSPRSRCFWCPARWGRGDWDVISVSAANSSNSLSNDCKRKHLNIQVAPLYEDVGRANSINPFGKAGQRNTRLAFLRHNRE